MSQNNSQLQTAGGQELKVIHMIGNAHIDPIWMWTWQEGYAEIKATFRSALDRMLQFPDFIFTCGCAAYYEWVEQNDPEMFEEIRQRVAEGRWVVVGGWWIQPDCNIPSGESFVRQGLYSQRYFLEKFGIMATVGYNVDSFGHNAMLPQILRQSGMEKYVFMRPCERENSLPANLFWWESPDGSRVLTFRIPEGYNTSWHEDMKLKIDKHIDLAQQQQLDHMCFYGVGNHGGGPTISHVNQIHELQEEMGADRLVMGSPNSYFAKMLAEQGELPVVRDELQHHASGCYSTHSETKMSNRKAENRLLAAERFMAMAHILKPSFPYAGQRLAEAWKKVLFNQFHDVMGGCSIKDAFDDVRESYGEALNIASVEMNAALQKMSWAIDTSREGVQYVERSKDGRFGEIGDHGLPVVVFNPHPWEIETSVDMIRPIASVTDDCDRPLELQLVRARRTDGKDKYGMMFRARVPAMGYRLFWAYMTKERELPASAAADQLHVTPTSLENRHVKLEINPHNGYIRSLVCKQNGVDLIGKEAGVPIVIDEHDSDTWGHGIMEYRNEIGRFSDAETKVLEEGPLRARLRVTSRYSQSVLRQDFILYKDSNHIEVRVQLDWREKLKMLKLSFPVQVTDSRGTYEIPYGHIERPQNGEEEPGQKWIDLSGDTAAGRAGLAIINNGKYSFDMKDDDMRMTVVRGSIFADHTGWNDRDDFCEYMDQGIQEFAYGLVPHAGDWQDSDVVRKAHELNMPAQYIVETYHRGELPQSYEGIRVSSRQIVVTVFKKAEDGDDYILRCHEAEGRAAETDFELPLLGRSWTASFGPHEIKTFRLPADAAAAVAETGMLELV